MKLFKNIATDINEKESQDPNAEVKKVGYAFFAIALLNATPKEGWTTSNMRSRFPVEDKLKELELNETILLENSEIDLIVGLLDYPWGMKHKNIIEFEDYMKGLQTSPDEKVVSKSTSKAKK